MRVVPTSVPAKTLRPCSASRRTHHPVGVDHQVDDGAAAAGCVSYRPGGQVDPALAPAKASLELVVHGRHVDVGEVVALRSDPRRVDQVGHLGVDLQAPHRLDRTPPQPGDVAQPGRGPAILGETVEQVPGLLRPGEGPTEVARQRGEVLRTDDRSRVGDVGVLGTGDQGLGLRRRRGPAARPRRPARTSASRSSTPARAPVTEAGGDATARLGGADDRCLRAGSSPVGGQGVGGPAQVDLVRLLHDDGAVTSPLEAASACSTQLLTGASLISRPPCSRVLSTLMSRNSAAGLPWLTGAPLPRLALAAVERPRQQVGRGPADGVHRPQKSVVVAW